MKTSTRLFAALPPEKTTMPLVLTAPLVVGVELPLALFRVRWKSGAEAIIDVELYSAARR